MYCYIVVISDVCSCICGCDDKENCLVATSLCSFSLIFVFANACMKHIVEPSTLHLELHKLKNHVQAIVVRHFQSKRERGGIRRSNNGHMAV